MNGDQTLTYLVVALALFIVILYYIYDTIKTRKKRRAEYIVRELLTCTKCNYRVEKDYEAGDFIGLIKGSCPKCGENLKIKGIYAIEKSKL